MTSHCPAPKSFQIMIGNYGIRLALRCHVRMPLPGAELLFGKTFSAYWWRVETQNLVSNPPKVEDFNWLVDFNHTNVATDQAEFKFSLGRKVLRIWHVLSRYGVD